MAIGLFFESDRLLNTDLSDADIEHEELTDADFGIQSCRFRRSRR